MTEGVEVLGPLKLSQLLALKYGGFHCFKVDRHRRRNVS